jgi:hypothetical protein
MTADGNHPVSAEERATAIVWAIQYINHFQIVCDFYDSGSLTQERFDLWKGFAVSIVASEGIKSWWEDELGKLAFTPRVRDLIDAELLRSDHPPAPFNAMWKIFMTQTWSDSHPTAWSQHNGVRFCFGLRFQPVDADDRRARRQSGTKWTLAMNRRKRPLMVRHT